MNAQPVLEQAAPLTQALQQPYRHGFVTDVEADALPAGPCENTGAPRTACVCTGPQQSDSWTLLRFESAANRRHGHRLRPNPPMRASATNGSRQTRESSDSFRLSPTMKQ